MNIADYVPSSILALRTEANLHVTSPHFARSLDVPGDVLEVGCFYGTMSIKYAFWLQALHLRKRVFAIDTFSGFQIDDHASSGARRVGDYNSGDAAYQELRLWSRVIPLVPIKGDATQVEVPSLTASFIWLDLDIAGLLDGALLKLDRLLSGETIIGLDDYGRPDCPTVKPWADAREHEGYWRKTHDAPSGTFIAFYQVLRG